MDTATQRQRYRHRMMIEMIDEELPSFPSERRKQLAALTEMEITEVALKLSEVTMTSLQKRFTLAQRPKQLSNT